jgi:hypothetical protein
MSGGKEQNTIGIYNEKTKKTITMQWPTDPLFFVNKNLNRWARPENLSDGLKAFIKMKSYL